MKRMAMACMSLVLLAACATKSPVATARPSQCGYDEAAMLALDENAFDQDLSNGGGGWRKIANIAGCEVAAADLIAAYKKKHGLDKPILNWHEGQMRASAGQTERAIALLSSARKTRRDRRHGTRMSMRQLRSSARTSRYCLPPGRD